MMSQHTVFMIGWEYPPHNSGGLGVACQGLTRALAKQSTAITFALPYQSNSQLEHMQLLSCIDPQWESSTTGQLTQPPFYAYSSLGSVFPVLSGKKLSPEKLRSLPTSQLEQKVQEYAAVVAGYSDTVGKKADIIHAHDWMTFPAAQKVQQKTGKPFIAHVHSTEYDRAGLRSGNQYIAHTEYEGMQHADKIIAVSHYTKHLLTTKYGIAAEKIAVVHNGIDPISSPVSSEKQFAPKRPVIVFMGRLTLHKGAQYFLELARAVLQAIPTALFVVAGSGDMYHELLLSTARTHLSASVVFSGFVRDAQREKLLERADVFVMPSISEPFGLVALEAAQRHTPVLISKNAGVSEVLTGGIAVDFWDIDKMTQTITRLLTDSQYSKDVQDAQSQNLTEITWEQAAKNVSNVYRAIFTGRKHD